ncbi:MAG: MBL fold metallo-hydrolase [Armatimonadota bacterium]|nr:MBL fold metallo-hydrolase [Armatimonadota bacterium]
MGRSGGYARAGEACSGYLVEDGGRRILLDLGNGVLSRLLERLDVYALDGLVLSHMHPDHVADFPSLRVALEWSHPSGSWGGHLPVMAGQDAPAYLAGYAGDDAMRCFDILRIRPGTAVDFCGFRLRFARASHPVPTYAVRIESGGCALVYTADTGPSDDVVCLAEGADLLLAEATLTDAYEHLAASVGHLTGSMAGEMAARAGVGRLLLTHFFPTSDPQESARQAQKAFGDVACAEERRTYEV